MDFTSGNEAMQRVQAIDAQLEMFERMKAQIGQGKVTFTDEGEQLIADLEAERAEIAGKYSN